MQKWQEEAVSMKLPSGSGSFEDLFDTMEKEIGDKTLKKINKCFLKILK